ncbi:MAG: hypothetical protein ACYDBQ_09820 [Thermoplasmatota archaeon]
MAAPWTKASLIASGGAVAALALVILTTAAARGPLFAVGFLFWVWIAGVASLPLGIAAVRRREPRRLAVAAVVLASVVATVWVAVPAVVFWVLISYKGGW